jgi:hypothetical protein
MSDDQARTATMLCRRKGREPIPDNEFLQAHLYEFLRAAMLNARLVIRQETLAALRGSPPR